MQCKKCDADITIKDTGEFISLKCNCEMIIIYPDKYITKKEKKDYDPKHKKK